MTRPTAPMRVIGAPQLLAHRAGSLAEAGQRGGAAREGRQRAQRPVTACRQPPAAAACRDLGVLGGGGASLSFGFTVTWSHVRRGWPQALCTTAAGLSLTAACRCLPLPGRCRGRRSNGMQQHSQSMQPSGV